MNVLIVGNIVKDVYLNLDNRTEAFETDKNSIKWLNLSFNASKHHFFSQVINYGGSAVSLEVLQKLGVPAGISGSNLNFADDDPTNDIPETVSCYRYILINDGEACYFAPSTFAKTNFTIPNIPVDCLYLDRSANLDDDTVTEIYNFLVMYPNTRLSLYIRDLENHNLSPLIPRANLIFVEGDEQNPAISQALESNGINPKKVIFISDKTISHGQVRIPLHPKRVNITTHLSLYSIAAATILGCFTLGHSVKDSIEFAALNVKNSKLNSSLTFSKLQELKNSPASTMDLEIIAKTLLVPNKGILAADESGGSIKKKFSQLGIPDTYDNRRDYRNIFFTTDHLSDYVSGVIIFDETAHQTADNGQNFVDFLIGQRIIPGIKVDKGLESFENSEETYTKGLEDLDSRLEDYYKMGLRFAKWRAAFEIRLDDSENLLTPSDYAITKNCKILAEYAAKCQAAGLVPIVEPEVVHDGNYSIDACAYATSRILDELFVALENHNVNLRACILKVNMILAGKQYHTGSTADEIGVRTAEVLKSHVPADLAGVVFLSGGQTPDQATANLSAVIKNGPFPWPVTFSFARALQDPALYTWGGNNTNADSAREAFKERLIANVKALKKTS